MSYLQELDRKMRKVDPKYDRIRAADTFIVELVNTRKGKGLTQSQVAEAAGIRQSHLSRIENFESEKVTFDTIFRYARAVGLSIRFVEEDTPVEVDGGGHQLATSQ